jgi:hypothetical protein
MTSLLLALALAPAFPDAGGTSAVDMFWDGEGSGTVTRGQLTKQTHAVSSVGPWTITDGDSDPDITFNASGQLADLKSPVSVKGTTYTGSGSTGFQLNIGSDPTSECRYPVANASWIFAGFFFKVNTETDFRQLRPFGAPREHGQKLSRVPVALQRAKISQRAFGAWRGQSAHQRDNK